MMKAKITESPANIKFLSERNKKNGFSLVELIVAVVVVAVLCAIALPYFYNYRKLYQAEDQALKVMDLIREANQLALTKRRTMRLEIDLTDNAVLLIDENTPGVGAADDKEIKAIPLYPRDEVRVDQIPSGVTKPDPPKYNDAIFADDTIGHLRGSTTITNHKVWAARFKSDGSMVNAAGNVFSANIYFWTPLKDANTNALTTSTPRNKKEIRLVTVFGGSGAARYWKHDGSGFVAF